MESKETKQLVGGDRHISHMHWSPDGKYLVFRSKQNQEIEEPMYTGVTISSVNVASGEVLDLCVVMNDVAGLVWAPDGKIYFICGYPMQTTCCGSVLFSVDP